MIRQLKLVLWFVFGLFLGGAATYASAETIPATAGPTNGWNLQGSPTLACQATKAAACDARCAAAGFGGKGAYDQEAVANCYCQIGGEWPYGFNTCTLSPTYSCPSGQGWTLSGSSCTRPDCAAGEVRQADGTCRKQCPASGANTSGVTGTPQGGTGTMPATLCIGGCSYDYGGVAVQVGNEWAAVAGRATGASCSTSAIGSNGTPTTSDPPAIPKPQSAADCIGKGQGFGTINGTVVCTGPADSTTKKDTKTESVTRPDGSTGSSSTTSTTVCNVAGSCTTTTTTNVSGGGLSGSSPNGTTTGTKTQDIVSFCQENPTAPQCKTNEQEDYCKSKPDAVGCKDLGTPSDGSDQIGAKQVGVSSITPVVLATNMSCPPDVVLPKGYGTITMGPACDFAGWVRPLVLAFAWLSAGLIVIGGVRT